MKRKLISRALIIVAIFCSCYLIFVKEILIRRDFLVEDVSKDAIFESIVGNYKNSYGGVFSLRARGKIDSPTKVFITSYDSTQKYLLRSLPAGAFDITWSGDYYETKTRVVFLHEKAKQGNLRITLLRGFPENINNGD